MVQAKDISDVEFAEAIDTAKGPWSTASWPAVTDQLEVFPAKVVLAKARSFERRGFLDDISCTCGCSGMWKLSQKWYEQGVVG